jgi:DNA-binding HxlR family transcriptional regulator
MYELKIPKDLTCGMAMTMEIIGSKWKPCLLYNISKGVNRPGQLQQHNPKASRQVLNQQLKELEQHGIIQKTIHHQLPPKVEYFLTEAGASLIPLLDLMEQWGSKALLKLQPYEDASMRTNKQNT